MKQSAGCRTALCSLHAVQGQLGIARPQLAGATHDFDAPRVSQFREKGLTCRSTRSTYKRASTIGRTGQRGGAELCGPHGHADGVSRAHVAPPEGEEDGCLGLLLAALCAAGPGDLIQDFWRGSFASDNRAPYIRFERRRCRNGADDSLRGSTAVNP